MYRCLPSKHQNFTSGTFKTIIVATHVIVLSKEVAPLFSAKDVSKIKRFCRNSRYVRISLSLSLSIIWFLFAC